MCKAIQNTFEKVKTKSPELMSEMLWNLNYILDFDEFCVTQVIQ